MRAGVGFLSALVLIGGGCTINRVVVSGSDAGAAADAGDDERTIERGWGVAAQGFAIAPCAPATVRLVNTTDDTLAGPALSLRRALIEASMSAAPSTVLFDQNVFAPGSGATIRVTDDSLPNPGGLSGVCIDARGRSVIVDVAYSGACAGLCTWELAAGSQLTGLVIKGNMGKIFVSESLVAGNRFGISYQALQVGAAAVIGPGNVFGHGVYGVRIDFYGATGAIPSIDGNAFGLEPTTHANLDLSVAVTAFERARIINNLGFSAMALAGSNGGAFSANRSLAGPAQSPDVSVQGERWVVEGNTIEGTLRNLPTGRGNTFSNNFIRDVTSTGLVAQPSRAVAGSIEGDCPERGQVEAYIRSGDSWAPKGSTVCDMIGLRWSIRSPDFVSGLEVRTLFTTVTASLTNTGPFSSTVTIAP